MDHAALNNKNSRKHIPRAPVCLVILPALNKRSNSIHPGPPCDECQVPSHLRSQLKKNIGESSRGKKSNSSIGARRIRLWPQDTEAKTGRPG
ncbi:hypothetical protein VTH06DRAFT_6476 [Thermothelomyces fergusii]